MNEVPEYVNEDELTPEEMETLEQLTGGNYPKPPEQSGIIGFFVKILGLSDTTKSGNLRENEIQAVRILKSTKSYAKKMGLDDVARYVNQISENILATSLSRDAILLNTAVTSKKQLSTESKSTMEGKSKWWERKQQQSQT